MIRYSFTLKIPKKHISVQEDFLFRVLDQFFFLFFWRLWIGLIRFLGCFGLKTS